MTEEKAPIGFFIKIDMFNCECTERFFINNSSFVTSFLQIAHVSQLGFSKSNTDTYGNFGNAAFGMSINGHILLRTIPLYKFASIQIFSLQNKEYTELAMKNALSFYKPKMAKVVKTGLLNDHSFEYTFLDKIEDNKGNIEWKVRKLGDKIDQPKIELPNVNNEKIEEVEPENELEHQTGITKEIKDALKKEAEKKVKKSSRKKSKKKKSSKKSKR